MNEELFEQFGHPHVFIIDGNPNYKKVLRKTFYTDVHVLNIHKGKRNQIIIRRWTYHRNERYYIEEIIGANHDLFTEKGTSSSGNCPSVIN